MNKRFSIIEPMYIPKGVSLVPNWDACSTKTDQLPGEFGLISISDSEPTLTSNHSSDTLVIGGYQVCRSNFRVSQTDEVSPRSLLPVISHLLASLIIAVIIIKRIDVAGDRRLVGVNSAT
jgi:hypothetical protein